MRLLVYNIAYGTGCPGGEAKRLLTVHRYLRTSAFHFSQIVGLVYDLQPDVIGLVEADSGSWRTSGLSHPEKLAQLLSEEVLTVPKPDSKYGPTSFLSRMPYLKSQTNALLARSDSEEKKHYFPCGTKKLILERESDGITVFLVHLGCRAGSGCGSWTICANCCRRDARSCWPETSTPSAAKTPSSRNSCATRGSSTPTPRIRRPIRPGSR